MCGECVYVQLAWHKWLCAGPVPVATQPLPLKRMSMQRCNACYVPLPSGCVLPSSQCTTVVATMHNLRPLAGAADPIRCSPSPCAQTRLVCSCPPRSPACCCRLSQQWAWGWRQRQQRGRCRQPLQAQQAAFTAAGPSLRLRRSGKQKTHGMSGRADRNKL